MADLHYKQRAYYTDRQNTGTFHEKENRKNENDVRWW